jgi:hypothetical protein
MTSTMRAGLIGGAAGCATMFLLDPDRGARRRALARDKAAWLARKTRDAAEATRRDVGNRIEGVRARAARPSDEAVDDARLQARVRAALGRVTSHPRAIAVAVNGGWVSLTGDALASEVPAIVSAANDVRGVAGVQNDLRSHAGADGVPSLQGSSDRPDSWSAWMRGGWSPAALLAAGVTTGAAAIAVTALARRGAAQPDLDGATVIDVVAIDALPSDLMCDDDLHWQ